MKREDAYTIATSMLQREHARWIQNALVLFGALASVLLLYKDFKEIMPLWFLMLIGFLISVMAVCVSLSIRRSTDAWNETLKKIEDSGARANIKTFEVFRQRIDEHKLSKSLFCKDLDHAKKKRQENCLMCIIFSVTRLYTLAAAVVAIVFLGSFIYLVCHERNSARIQEFRHGEIVRIQH